MIDEIQNGEAGISVRQKLNQIISQINLLLSANGVEWDDLLGVPTTFPPQSHSHNVGDVSGLASRLANPALIHRPNYEGTREDGSPLRQGDRWFPQWEPNNFIWDGEKWTPISPVPCAVIDEDEQVLQFNKIYLVDTAIMVSVHLPDLETERMWGAPNAAIQVTRLGIIEIVCPPEFSYVIQQPQTSVIHFGKPYPLPKTPNYTSYGLYVRGGSMCRIMHTLDHWIVWANVPLFVYDNYLREPVYD